jgi:hypothetical protein
VRPECCRTAEVTVGSMEKMRAKELPDPKWCKTLALAKIDIITKDHIKMLPETVELLKKQPSVSRILCEAWRMLRQAAEAVAVNNALEMEVMMEDLEYYWDRME